MLNATVLFLTFGSAWTYVLAGSGETVANCHKMPSSMFTRRFVEPEEAAEALGSALERWREHNPRLKVVLTVSPVRHWKDGAVENSLSKSALVVASHALVQRLPGTVLYFPAFEIMMDDLRDYRFYAEVCVDVCVCVCLWLPACLCLCDILYNCFLSFLFFVMLPLALFSFFACFLCSHVMLCLMPLFFCGLFLLFCVFCFLPVLFFFCFCFVLLSSGQPFV